MIGTVTSTKMTGAITVTVESFKIHPLYKKRLKRSKKFLVYSDEALSVGDQVEIGSVRPKSRRVSFAVLKVVSRSQVLPEVKEETTARKVVKPVIKKAKLEKVENVTD